MLLTQLNAKRGSGHRLPAFLLCIASLLEPLGACAAQNCQAPNPTASISTDRASFSNASTTVPCRALQFENGFSETVMQGRRSWDLPETLVRFGAATKTELRFTAPDFYWNLQSGRSFATGPGDLSAGAKEQLGPVHGFDVAAIETLSFPTGAQSISSHGYDPTLQLPWSHPLSGNWSLQGMFSVAWPTQSRQHNVTGQATALFDRQFTKAWDGFAEYAGTFPGDGGPQHIVDFGMAYKLTGNQQVDVSGGVGLSAAAFENFIGAGYSFRFDLYRAR